MSEASQPPHSSNRNARGVVPFQPDDPVLKSPYAHGVIALLTLRSDIDRGGLEAWLGKVDVLIHSLRAATDKDSHRVATVAVGFGPSLFINASTGQPRFPDITPPAGFAQLPAVPQGSQVLGDVAVYLVATAEAEIAKFLHGIADGVDVVTVSLQSGYKSWPDRDAFGYADGLRNVRANRNEIVFVDADRNPEEPHWAIRGTYLAFMRIIQNRAAFDALPPEEQDKVIGRHRDGTRLDLPDDTPVADEVAFTGDTPSTSSHIRKAGPRENPHEDATGVFRRGMPFYEVSADGRLIEGLLFASFQASMDQFDAILNRWMFNTEFPKAGAGTDALFAQGYATIETWGFFFVPPDIDGPIGTGMLKPTPKERPTKTGRVAVRKKVVDANNSQTRSDLGGFSFQITRPDGTPIGEPLTTNSAGHALSEEIPVGDYKLVELSPPSPFTAAAPQDFTLKSAQVVLHVTNTAPPGTPTYGS
jgi:deferrochelatase/peroxidase EfeB